MADTPFHVGGDNFLTSQLRYELLPLYQKPRDMACYNTHLKPYDVDC